MLSWRHVEKSPGGTPLPLFAQLAFQVDRLGRNLKDLVALVDEMRAAGIGLRVLTGSGAQIDTTTHNGRLMFGIFAALADRRAVAKDVARKLGVTTTTLYEYVNGDGSPKELGRRILGTAAAPLTEV